MIDYTNRLDKALRIAAKAHEKQGQHRKGSGIPYVIHPVGVMMIASNATEDEDTLVACLLHDIIEDVDSSIYSKEDMKRDFGERVVRIVLDVSKDESISDWHERSEAYLTHLEQNGSDEAVIVCTSDKIHNLQSIVIDYEKIGDELWNRFSTNSYEDQLWWYDSVLQLAQRREAPQILIDRLSELIIEIKSLTSK